MKSSRKPESSDTPSNARALVARALAGAAAQFPELAPIPLQTAGLDERDARLALAIHRNVMQRWMTLEFLLNLHLTQPAAKLEPKLRAILLSAAAQLLGMDRLPRHAIVDESVTLAKRTVRPGAGAMVNAVLRRMSDLIGKPVTDRPWEPAADRLPLEQGYIPLSRPCLPAMSSLDFHLAVATSHPRKLIERWLASFGPERTIALCQHDLVTPPVIVAVEKDFSLASQPTDPNTAPPLRPHEIPGFFVWDGSHTHLMQFLAAHPHRRVQDPTSSQAVQLTRSLDPKTILDFCAGRGTKTRQLATMFPEARIVANEPDESRHASLTESFTGNPRVTIAPRDNPASAWRYRKFDLLVLDLPCSNTGVLARRPEARYRFAPASLNSVATLQRQIVEQSLPLISPSGFVLYSTCSIDDQENRAQVKWLTHQFDAKLIEQESTFPEGKDTSYRDGGYRALLQLP